MTSMTTTKFATFWRQFCLPHRLRNLTKTGFSIFRKSPDTFLAATVLRIEFFLSRPTALISLPFLSFAFTLLFFSDNLIFSSASTTCTCLTALISDGFFSFRSGDYAYTWLVGALEMNAWIATIFVVEFFCFRLVG